MRLLRVASLIALLLMAVAIASADQITFNLDTPNPAISGFTGPYASVLVNLTDSTHATITFNSLTNGGKIFLMGDGGSVGVNVNASTWTLGSITGSNSGTGFTPGPYSNGGAGNEDGFGSFNQTINSFDGFTHSSTTISFSLTNTGGTWSNAGNVLTGNADGHLAASHIFVTSSPANASNGALATGFATGNGSVPEPSSMMLLGTGLFGVAAVIRRRFRG